MSDHVIECASRAGRDFSEFMKGEKGMMEALASVDEFGEQLRLNGCVNHHFVSYMMRNSIMQAFMDMAKAERVSPLMVITQPRLPCPMELE